MNQRIVFRNVFFASIVVWLVLITASLFTFWNIYIWQQRVWAETTFNLSVENSQLRQCIEHDLKPCDDETVSNFLETQ